MDLELLQKIFLAIKEDDLEFFSETVSARRSALNLCFGRFPVLSCCYLFSSEKIISAYELELINVATYNRVIEFSEIYSAFKSHAKKCLRFYIEEDSVVTPMEMLAIINDAVRLRKVFARYQKSEQVAARIKNIYLVLHKQKIKRQDNLLFIKKPKLSSKKLLSVILIVVLSLIMTGMFFATYIYAGEKFGNGSEEKPIIIRSYQQLCAAVKKGDMHYALASDIAITENWETVDFDGFIDGNGYMISVNANLNNPIIGILNGTIENLNIKISDQDITLEEDRSYLVKTNNGQINNVNISLNVNAVEQNSQSDIYLAVVCLQNEGSIIDCRVNAEIVFHSDANKDTFLSGFAATNNGIINRCELSEDSYFVSDTVDIAGIVATNGEKGEIINSKNYAKIEQLSGTASWHPHCAGIALKNLGLISNATNYGKIIASSANDSGNFFVYLGGIVAINKSKVSKSKNLGELIANSQNSETYIGGICGFNEATSAVIEACGNGGKYRIESPSKNVFMFGGGIAGGNVGTIMDCFNYGNAESDNDNALLCTIAGFINDMYTRMNNNVALKNDNAPYFAYTVKQNMLTGQYILYIWEEGCSSVDTLEQLKGMEVYWE